MAVTLQCSLTVNSQDVANNRSNVTATVKAVSTNGSYNNYTSGSNAATGTITFGGNASGSFSFTHTFAKNTTTTIYTRTFYVSHNSDGTGSVSFSVSFDTKVSSGTVTGNASLNLNTIATASTMTCGDAYLTFGKQSEFAISRRNENYTHTISATMDVDHSEVAGGVHNIGVIAQNVGRTFLWTPGTDLAALLTGLTGTTIHFTCTTYLGSTVIGTSTLDKSCFISSSDGPKLTSSSITDTKGYYSTYGAYVQSQSELQVNASGTPGIGATIAKWDVSLDGLSANGTSMPLTLGAPPTSGNRDVRIRLTDSRGSSILGTKAITVAAYTGPTIDLYAARVNSSYVEDDEGTIIRIHVTGSAYNVNNANKNTATVKIEYKRTDVSSWTTISNASRGSSFDFYVNQSGASASYMYDVRVTVTDSFGTAVERETTVGTAKPILDFKAGGGGVGILTVADREGVTLGNNLYLRPFDTDAFFDLYKIFFLGESGTPIETLTLGGGRDVIVGRSSSTGGPTSGSAMYADNLVGNYLSVPTYKGAEGTVNYAQVAHMLQDAISFMTNVDTSDYGITLGDVSWPGLLGGYIGKQLWSGSWSADSITVPNSVNYRIFIIASGGSPQEAMIGLRNQEGNRIYCFSANCPQDNIMYVNAGSFTISSNTWRRTMPRAWGFSGASIPAPNQILVITNIVGVI